MLINSSRLMFASLARSVPAAASAADAWPDAAISHPANPIVHSPRFTDSPSVFEPVAQRHGDPAITLAGLA